MKSRSNEIEIIYNWNKLDLKKDKISEKPAVYRFVFIKKNKNRAYYIGETSNLKRRINQYINYKSHNTQKTNINLKNKMKEFPNHSIEILKINSLKVLGRKNFHYKTEQMLKSPFIRKFIENFFAINIQSNKKELFNKCGKTTINKFNEL